MHVAEIGTIIIVLVFITYKQISVGLGTNSVCVVVYLSNESIWVHMCFDRAGYFNAIRIRDKL